MTSDVLLKLLQAGLLGDLGDDDQRRERAEVAAAGVTEWLIGEGLSNLAVAVLLSVDESTGSASDLVLEYADQCLVAAWPSVRNAFPEPPSDLLRAIVLQAAVNVADRDPDLGAAMWYVLRTIEALDVSVGRWDTVVEAEMSGISAAVAVRLEEAWLPPTDFTKLRMPATAGSEPTNAPNGHSASLNEALEPYKANFVGNPGPVAGVLAEQVPPALANLEATLAALVKASPNGGDLKSFAENLGNSLRAQLESQWAVIEASRLRETLLWWRLAAHSEVLGGRYADSENPATGAVAAALDVYRLIPSVAPEAVEHLLAEAVASYCGTQPAITLADISTSWEQLKPDSITRLHGRGLVVPTVASGDAGPPQLSLSRKLTPAEAATLVFRDLQIIHLLDAGASVATEPEA